ncbi:MAG: histone deacetylase [Chitinophagales bacterium]|nr:histone deacetylase [Chitinophagales bacterium]
MLYIACDPIYAHPLPEGHRFPMLKYELIPQQLIYEGVIDETELYAPAMASEHDILLTHSGDYWRRMKNLQLTTKEMRAIGFPLSAQLVEREARIMQGTIDCALHALKHGVALNVAGGTHHAFADRGEGFCLLNDFAVAANYLLHHKLVKQVLVVDLDVHQGNGTAALFRDRPEVFTFSMHGERNYPFHKEASDLDIGLPEGMTGEEYLDLLNDTLPALLNKIKPDIVCYLSGVDVLETDKFGKLKLSIEDCAARDEVVFRNCRTNNIPVAVAMGGGYSPDIRHIVTAHCNTFRLAKSIWEM